jgi:hypothetical protein
MQAATQTDKPHRRLNLLTGEWVLVSPHRTLRPWSGLEEQPESGSVPHHDPECYLCPGNSRADGAINPDYRATFVFTKTYQAAFEDRQLDLTYMEYELLKFFATHPGKVFTREQLLSRVWGYEYYGGARTVDVHVRRLRAKLGEEHASLIQTVRSVGYRFGQARSVPS